MLIQELNLWGREREKERRERKRGEREREERERERERTEEYSTGGMREKERGRESRYVFDHLTIVMPANLHCIP